MLLKPTNEINLSLNKHNNNQEYALSAKIFEAEITAKQKKILYIVMIMTFTCNSVT